MNEQHKAVVAALPVRQLPPFHPAKSRRPCNAQFALPAALRRQLCRTRQRFSGATREIEFAKRLANGGEFSGSMHQPIS
ncbi:MAG: hypothetical protein L0Z50_09035 [Verrucomicrobiales bacterium]|nr:hypothetical protein [Verrucomicrobiales bacterium]